MPTSKIPELLKHSSCRADLLGAIKNHRETVANEIQRLSLILEKIDSITDTFAGFDTTTGKLEIKSIDARLAIFQDASYIVTDPTVGRYSFKNRMSNFALSKGNPANVVAFGTTSSLADFIASDTIRYKYQFAQLKHWEDLGSTPIMDIPAGDYLTIRFENQREARLSAYYRLVEHIVDNHLDTDDTFYEGIVGCGMPPVNEAEDIVELQIRLN
jgi:effector-binding domain-containing protein